MSKAKKGGKGATSVMTFHQSILMTMNSSVLQTQGNPTGLGERFLQEADAWTLFRWRSLRFRIFGGSTHTVSALAALGVQEGLPDTPAATVGNVMDLFASIGHCGTGQTTWSDWVRVPPSVLAGQLPWYQTVLGAFPAVAEVPFTFCAVGSATGAIRVELWYTVEFKSQSAAANTPLSVVFAQRLREEREAQRTAKERGKLLGIMSSPAKPELGTGLSNK
jgi:hypothetical protein